MIGTRIENFILVEKLAEGGMGAVYIAEHTKLREIRKVIKVLLPVFAERDDIRARFEREAKASSVLKHPHILEIDNFGSLPDGQLWILMPYLDGQPLNTFLKHRGVLPEPTALIIILQLCSALEHAHRCGIIHRDLKPGNVFVREPYDIQLLDFGIAKMRGSIDTTRPGSSIGTPAYMAVEQYEHGELATAVSDVYSTAIIAYEMVSGALPWGSPHQSAAVLYHKQMTTPPALDGVSPAWQRHLATALATKPAERFGSARALAMALAQDTPDGLRLLAQFAPEFLRNSSPVLPTPVPRRSHNDITLRARPTEENTPVTPALRSRPRASDQVTLRARPQPRMAAGVIEYNDENTTIIGRRMLLWKLSVLSILVCSLAIVIAFLLVRG